MTVPSRVVWTEGMHLLPHHFQLQSQYAESSIHVALEQLFSYPYGLTSIRINDDALRNGVFSIQQASGVMPDGLFFRFPDEALPESLDLREGFAATDESVIVVLAIAHKAKFDEDGAFSEASRFHPHRVPVFDEVTGRDEQEVTVARKNFRVILEASAQEEGLAYTPLAQVKRDGRGSYIQDPEYIPPVLWISASERVMDLLARTVEMLEGKASNLARTRGGVEGATGEALTGFWLSHAVQSALPALRHHLTVRTTHPEQVFSDLARLAGALCTFSMDARASELPTYDHNELSRCFKKLDQHIRGHLDVVIPKAAISIDLLPLDPRIVQEVTSGEQQKRPGVAQAQMGGISFLTGSINDDRALQGAEWILGVRSETDVSHLIREVPRLIKICGGGKGIVKLVTRMMAGPPLQHMPTPPSAISRSPGTQYFRIAFEGPGGEAHGCFGLIKASNSVGVCLLGELSRAQVEIRVLPPGD